MEEAAGMQHQNTVPMETNLQPMDGAEKVLKQSEVNELVGRIKHEAYTKGLREGMTQNTPSPQGGSGMGGMPQITEDQIRQMIADEAHKNAQIAAAHNTLSSFVQKMGTGKGEYSDFDETVANLGDLKNIPHVVQLAADMDNTADVMYELGKNPGKVASLTTLSYINPHLARVEMNKLSSSIKANKEAAKAQNAEEPLSRVNPSTVGADNGNRTVRDLRQMSWARA